MTKLISKPKSLQPGYGTILGTSLIKETMNVQKKGFSKKVLGLGVAAGGFAGGGALGTAGAMTTYILSLCFQAYNI